MKATTGKAFRLEGGPELTRTLTAIRKTLNAEGNIALADRVREALLDPAKVIRDEAQDLAPVGPTGKLKSAIKADKGKGAAAFAAVDLKIAPYASFVEKGTSKMRARPYFRPAVNAVRPTIARMIAERLPAIIADVARHEAWRAPVK